MFLQRNVAGQVYTIPGSLRAVADGSAVTAAATLSVQKDGTSAASAGTLTHLSGGAWKYAPTQGETDCKILGWVLEATGAVTVCGSLRTTNSDVNDAVRLGLAGIPNAAAGATGGLPTVDASNAVKLQSGTGANQINLVSGNVALQTGQVVADSAGTTTLLARLTSTRAGLLDNLDATISSRMATFTYTAPPTAAAIRSEVDSNSTQLAAIVSGQTTINTNVLTRSTYSGADTAGTTTLLSRVTAAVALASQIPPNFTTALFASAGVFSTGALANAPTGGSAPTAAAIRTEMDANSTKLANLDAAISTRSTYAGGAVASVAAGVTLADASVTSAKFSVGSVNGAATGILERLMLLAARFLPVSGGSVTAPKSGNGSLVVKGSGGTTISTQTVSDDATTQTLGAAS